MHLFIQSDPSLIVELLWLWYNRTGTLWTSRWPVVPRSSDESRTPKYIGSGKSVNLMTWHVFIAATGCWFRGLSTPNKSICFLSSMRPPRIDDPSRWHDGAFPYHWHPKESTCTQIEFEIHTFVCQKLFEVALGVISAYSGKEAQHRQGTRPHIALKVWASLSG